MDIRVTMTADESDMFRAYQKEKASLERVTTASLKALQKEHSELCSAVVAAIVSEQASLYADNNIAESSLTVSIKSMAAAGRAIELAAEWFL